jgi:hypothetical protein
MNGIKKKFHIRKEYLRCVFNDPEFIKRASALHESDLHQLFLSKDCTDIVNDFDIDYIDVSIFNKNGGIESYNKMYVIVGGDLKSGHAKITVDSQATKAEYAAAWEEVLKFRRDAGIRSTKRKSPYDYNLVYALHRARKKALTFKEIFRLYSDGTLPLYRGSTSQYKSEDSLEKFYQRHKPILKGNFK